MEAHNTKSFRTVEDLFFWFFFHISLGSSLYPEHTAKKPSTSWPPTLTRSKAFPGAFSNNQSKHIVLLIRYLIQKLKHRIKRPHNYKNAGIRLVGHQQPAAEQGLLIGEGICRQHNIREIPKLGTLVDIWNMSEISLGTTRTECDEVALQSH